MKKIVSVLLVLVMGAILAVNCFAADRTLVEVPKSTPVIDGIINSDEWDSKYSIVMDSKNCKAWVGEIIDKATFYYAWDEKGLYCAAKVLDSDVCLTTDDSSPSGLDCFQIALNPNGIIADDQQGIFFSMGVTTTENVEIRRHNYDDTLITKNCTGMGKETNDGWQIEVLIPWSEINVLTTKFTPAVGFEFSAIICLLDRDDFGVTTNAFKTVLDGKEVGDFTVGSYALKLKLIDNTPAATTTTAAPTTTTTAKATTATAAATTTKGSATTTAASTKATAVTTAKATTATTKAPTTAAQTSDPAFIMAAFAVCAAAAALVIAKKRSARV